MKKYYSILLFLLLFSGMVLSQNKEIQPYVDFLKKQNTDPVDYVFELFEKYDIVILGERDHRDTTQYELFNKIISDPRFIKNVGNVFTEVGVFNQRDRANRVLKGNYANYADFEKELRCLYRDMDYEPIWGMYNYWILLSSIYKTNSVLSEKDKITFYPTDIEYDWGMFETHRQQKAFREFIETGIHDAYMGYHFIEDYERILKDPNQHRKKALVIFNRPHSYQSYHNFRDDYDKFAASYIYDKYPGKVANVMVNSVVFQKSGKDYLISQGKWDAAFRKLGNPSLGFDFDNSHFGNDRFDHYDRTYSDSIGYKNVFTGFIFYKPILDWKLTLGIPNIIDDEFMPEYLRRIRLVKEDWTEEEIESDIKFYNNFRTYNFRDAFRDDTPHDSIESYINHWLK